MFPARHIQGWVLFVSHIAGAYGNTVRPLFDAAFAMVHRRNQHEGNASKKTFEEEAGIVEVEAGFGFSRHEAPVRAAPEAVRRSARQGKPALR